MQHPPCIVAFFLYRMTGLFKIYKMNKQKSPRGLFCEVNREVGGLLSYL